MPLVYFSCDSGPYAIYSRVTGQPMEGRDVYEVPEAVIARVERAEKEWLAAQEEIDGYVVPKE